MKGGREERISGGLSQWMGKGAREREEGRGQR